MLFKLQFFENLTLPRDTSYLVQFSKFSTDQEEGQSALQEVKSNSISGNLSNRQTVSR